MDRSNSGNASRGRGAGRGQNPQQPRGGRRPMPQQDSRAPPSAWGRGAAGEPQQSAWGRGAAGGPQPSAWGRGAAGGPQPSAWGQRAAGGAEPSAWGQSAAGDASRDRGQQFQRPPQERPPGRGPNGRPTSQGDGAIEASQGAVAKDESRGAVRGKRVLHDLVCTRSQDCVTKSGTTGHKVIVQSNYFRILKKPSWIVHQYRVDFSPQVDVDRIRKGILGSYKDTFGGYVFDGTTLYSNLLFTKNLPNDTLELVTKDRDGEPIQIKLKHVGAVEPTDMQHLQVLNLILRRAMGGLKLQLVGRNFFDAMSKISMVNHRMEIWPGYQTSIRQHENDILLCADIAHKVMRTDTLYSILTNCIREAGDYQDAFKHLVLGMVVLTDYNNKTYRVDDVDYTQTPMSKFATKTGEISYMEYYKMRYNITIRDPQQPLLLSRPRSKDIRGGQSEVIMLIPEIARATGLTDAMRNNFRLMKDMGEYTRLVPERRIERLRTFNKRLLTSEASVASLTEWDMKLDTNLVEITGRVLPTEKILFGGGKTYTCDDSANWTREFRNTVLFTQVEIKRWCVIVPRRNVREVQEFVSLCARVARGMRMNFANPLYEEMPDDRNGSYSQAIDNVVAKDPQIVMVVLVNNNEEKYSCVKKKCCVDRPVPSQVVTLRVIAPRGDKAGGLMSVATKVVIQMNAKLMGIPWMVEVPLKGLMVVGFDVCHSGKDKNNSFGALVAAMDFKSSGRYYSGVMKHLKGQELSNEISMYMSYALQAYKSVNKGLPERILFYRDGVGDGQLHQVVTTELEHMKKKLDEIYKKAGIESGCRLAFIVVSKRINTRYFVNRRNPVPGTVVDDVITLPERYDFFLVSQSVRQGTVSPTSYNVIFDSMGMTADKIQMLTYKMTHLYYNWSGTCRVPAVCQYAHKLAFLVAESIFRAPSNALENQLYFL